MALGDLGLDCSGTPVSAAGCGARYAFGVRDHLASSVSDTGCSIPLSRGFASEGSVDPHGRA